MKGALLAREVVEVPKQDEWRLPYLCSLLSQRRQAHDLALEEEEKYLTDLIESLAVN